MRRWILTGPWPVVLAAGAGWLAVVSWPLLLRQDGRGSVVVPWVVVLLSVVGYRLYRRREEDRATGWTPRQRYDLLTRAEDGSLPADPADLDRLRGVVERADREQAGGWYVVPIAFVVLAGLPLLDRAAFGGRTEWLVAAYYLALGPPIALAARRTHRRRAGLRERLGVGRPATG